MTDNLQSEQLVGHWEKVYNILTPEQLPWNAGKPDPDLSRLVKAGTIAPGAALELGVGPGHDAVFLASNGFKVLAVDVAPTAIKLSKERAETAGVDDKIDFRPVDALTLKLDKGAFTFVNDRGWFHFLPRDKWPEYLALVRDCLAPGGKFLLRVFSDKELLPGPARFNKDSLLQVFGASFDLLESAEGIFAGPQRAKAVLALLQKKA